MERTEQKEVKLTITLTDNGKIFHAIMQHPIYPDILDDNFRRFAIAVHAKLVAAINELKEESSGKANRLIETVKDAEEKFKEESKFQRN